MNGPWRAALRLARREVWRARGRSALVATMVGGPALLITAATVLLGTMAKEQSEPAVLLRELGAAEAHVIGTGRTAVAQDPLGRLAPAESAEGKDGAEQRAWTEAELAEATGWRVLPVRVGGALVRTDAGALSVRVREFDAADPVTAGLVAVLDGRLPRDAGEVAVSPAVADRGFGPGSTVRLVDGGERSVVGVVRNPAALKESELLARPGSVLAADTALTYLADTGGTPVSWSRVRELNELGLTVISRAVLDDPPPDDQLPAELRSDTFGRGGITAMLPVLIIGCIALEVALLAGPAFAVGARRQRRSLALVVATGGTPVDVRRMVLAQGLVLGLGSAALGTVLGIVAVAAALPLLGQLVGVELSGPAVSPVYVPLIFAVATVSAVAAAVLPAAQAARQDTVAALGGRRGDVHFRRRRGPLIGLLVAAVGLVLAVFGMRARAGGETPVALGTMALVVGVVLVMPALLGGIGRLGARLPLALRLATRDLARHRSRSASAMSAIMGAVIGVTALAIGSSSDFAQSRRDYQPKEPMGSLTITFDNPHAAGRLGVSDREVETLAGQIGGLLPGHRVTVLHAGGGSTTDGGYQNVDLLLPGCVQTPDVPCIWAWALPNLVHYGLPMLVVDPDTVTEVAGRPLGTEHRAVIESGGVLVPSADALHPGGIAVVASGSHDRIRRTELSAVALPELIVTEGESLRLVAGLVGTRETAQRLGLAVTADRIVAAPGEAGISPERQATVDELVQGFVPGSQVYVERGFAESYLPLWLMMAGLAGLVVLAGTLTATALAMNDARPDLATLAALGASPRVRRSQAMAQAAVTGLLGALLGVAIGAVPGLAITWPLTAPSEGGHIVDIPWALLGTVVLAVPLTAVLGAGLLTRSRLPMVRRVH